MKVFDGQTKIDISTGQDVPHFTRKTGNFSIRNKLISFSVLYSFVEIEM